MYQKLLNFHNDFRVMPKTIFAFIAYCFYEFHTWFMTLPPTDWGLAQYGLVLATVVGFGKFYMQTNASKKGDIDVQNVHG